MFGFALPFVWISRRFACKIQLIVEPNILLYSGSIPFTPTTSQNTDTPYFGRFLAGAEGIEPSSAVLETDILPLNYAPNDHLSLV